MYNFLRSVGAQASKARSPMYNLPFPFEQLDIRVLIAPAKLYIVHGKLYIVHGKLYIMNYAFPSSQAVILSLF